MGKKIKPVLNVTFPRSGHTMTVRVLSEYFDYNLSYCEFYKAKNACHCNKVPCKNNCRLQKHHDFIGYRQNIGLLKLPKNLPVKYMIHYRDPIPAIMSWYEMHEKNRPQWKKKDWESFAYETISFYKQWVAKWVYDIEIPRKLVVKYENLVADPKTWFLNILYYMGEVNPDHKKLEHAIKINKIKNKRKITDFKYYNAKFIKKLKEYKL